MKLNALLTTFTRVAPEELAEDWDQVGIHLAGNGKPIRKALMCIDLTPAVLDEAIAQKCQLIVAYHPPIFQPLTRLADRDWKETMLALTVRKGIAIYSPHTALDAVRPGMNDWLCDGLGKASVRWSIGSPAEDHRGDYKIVVYVPNDDAKKVRQAMFDAGGGTIGKYRDCSFTVEGTGSFTAGKGTHPAIGKPGRPEAVPETRIELVCDAYSFPYVIKACRAAHPYEEPAIDTFQLIRELPIEEEHQTPGRVHVLENPVPAKRLVTRVKKVLGQKHLKASIPDAYGEPPFAGAERPNTIQTIAVCVGAGGSLFEKYPLADAYITGEMQHHHILDLHQQGKVVILAGHTNTERPFLKNYRQALIDAGGEKVDWLISEADRAPMDIV